MGTAVQTADVDLAEPKLKQIAAGLPEADAIRLRRACEFAVSVYAGKLLGTGEPALEHALGIASSLAALRLDAETRIAGILFAVPQYLADSRDKLSAEFSPAVAALVAGLAKLNQLRIVTRALAGQETGAAHSSQAEVLRKMLLAMVEDIRVVLVRLASRTQTLRFLARSPDTLRRPYAQETLDIFAPLANRLGIWQLKWEMEDYAFRYLEPELYVKIASLLDEKRDEREGFIADALSALDAELRAAGVRAEVQGRPKHIYSIYSKMRGKGLDFSELYDVRALRVLVDSVKDCYTALGIVHNLWTPIPKEFDDYISRPKGNNYRSLHTAVFGSDGRALEVQIRTHEMHRHAELGVLRTGATRRRERGDRLPLPGPTPPGETHSTRKSPGCGRCSRGATTWSNRPIESSSSSRRRQTTRSTCSRRKGGCWICRRDRRRWISPTTCIPISATIAAAPRSTASWCRSITSSPTASGWKLSPPRPADRAATG